MAHFDDGRFASSSQLLIGLQQAECCSGMAEAPLFMAFDSLEANVHSCIDRSLTQGIGALSVPLALPSQ